MYLQGVQISAAVSENMDFKKFAMKNSNTNDYTKKIFRNYSKKC